jgi:hypothetical protein
MFKGLFPWSDSFPESLGPHRWRGQAPTPDRSAHGVLASHGSGQSLCPPRLASLASPSQRTQRPQGLLERRWGLCCQVYLPLFVPCDILNGEQECMDSTSLSWKRQAFKCMVRRPKCGKMCVISKRSMVALSVNRSSSSSRQSWRIFHC